MVYKKLILRENLGKSHDLAAVSLLEIFRLSNIGKGNDTGVAHHREHIAADKVEDILCINEFGGEIVGRLQVFCVRLMCSYILGRTGEAAEVYPTSVSLCQDVAGMHILVDPHAADAAIFPLFLSGGNAERRVKGKRDQ